MWDATTESITFTLVAGALRARYVRDHARVPPWPRLQQGTGLKQMLVTERNLLDQRPLDHDPALIADRREQDHQTIVIGLFAIDCPD